MLRRLIRKAKQWYNQPPQWVIRKNKLEPNNPFQEKKAEQNNAIRDMEQSLDRNDIKGFFYLVKKLTKNRKQAEQIKGIQLKGERMKLGEETERKIIEFYNNLYLDGMQDTGVNPKGKDQMMTCDIYMEAFCSEEEEQGMQLQQSYWTRWI
ncbi:hypothetical protein OXYTRIMIC_022 [Oxytricha trifallax]|uniref:Uncharacterized protein n=1 Tax=Oxytricha trifallax TaxID=1172189 RepID=A0A073HXB9_9SPIT|nr:hypothetical protein OXYTRIMIC_022 [Oxytricha trifallax]